MFVITQMYHVFLRHWREYAREGRSERAPWAGDADALGRRFARALDALERHRGERFPEFQERLVTLMGEMQTFMNDHEGDRGARRGEDR